MTRRSTFTDQSVTYGAIGSTLDPDLLRYPPAGFRPAEDTVRLGSGQERFDRAAESLMTWGIQRGAGFEIDDVSAGTGAQDPGIVYDADGTPLPEQPAARAEQRFAADGTPYVAAGMTATLRRKRRFGTATTPVLVVYVIDEPERVGFAYGTLAGHAEVGEEAFLAEQIAPGRLRLTVRVHARPATVLAWLGGPVVTRLQGAAARRYLSAWAAAIAEEDAA